MRILVAASLLAIALAPLAGASHTICPGPEFCFRNSGYSNGDCDTTSGQESTLNVIYASSDPAQGVGITAGGSTHCSDSSASGSHMDASGMFVYARADTPAGPVASDFGWNAWTKSGTGGFQSFCATNLFFATPATGAQMHRLGCPLGTPPEVPVLLP